MEIKLEKETEINGASPHIALVAVQLMFGTFPVVGKVVLQVIPSVALVGFRVGIAAAILYGFQRFGGNLRLAKPSDYYRLALMSLFGVVFNQLLFVTGLSLTKAANTSLLSVTIPIFTILIGAALGSERMSFRKAVGIALAAAGVLILIDPTSAAFSSETKVGDFLIILNSFSYGIYVASSKDVITRNGALKSITWIFMFAAIVTVPVGLFSLSAVDISGVAPLIWLLVVHVAVFGTAAPYMLNAWALARVSPSTVAVYIYLQPIIGFLSAAVFLGENIGLKFIGSAALIFAGVFLVTRKHIPASK